MTTEETKSLLQDAIDLVDSVIDAVLVRDEEDDVPEIANIPTNTGDQLAIVVDCQFALYPIPGVPMRATRTPATGPRWAIDRITILPATEDEAGSVDVVRHGAAPTLTRAVAILVGFMAAEDALMTMMVNDAIKERAGEVTSL